MKNGVWNCTTQTMKHCRSLKYVDAVDRYTCRMPHFHMYSHCTDHTKQMHVYISSSPKCAPIITCHPRVMFHPAPRMTLNTCTRSLSSTSPVLLSSTSPIPDLSSTYPLPAVKIHGGMVPLRNSSPLQVMSPKATPPD